MVVNSGNDLNQRLKIYFAMLAIHNVVRKNVVSKTGFLFLLILSVVGNFLDATEIREDSLTFPMSEWRPNVKVEMGKNSSKGRVGTLQQSRWISTSASTTSRIRTSTLTAFNGDSAFKDTGMSFNDASVLWRECEDVHHGTSSDSSTVLRLPLTELAHYDYHQDRRLRQPPQQLQQQPRWQPRWQPQQHPQQQSCGNRDDNRNSNREPQPQPHRQLHPRWQPQPQPQPHPQLHPRRRLQLQGAYSQVLWRECEEVHCGTSSPQIWAYAKSGSLVLSRMFKNGPNPDTSGFPDFKYRGSPSSRSLV